jgi:hypothetical protein
MMVLVQHENDDFAVHLSVNYFLDTLPKIADLADALNEIPA